MNVGIIVFPGTNCEMDTKLACDFFGFKSDFIWHEEKIEKEYDIIFIPGGFSYGDYISAGRLAKFSKAIQTLPYQDSLIVGICNGFQILTEAKLLEGNLVPNTKGKFICENAPLHFFDKRISLPIAHQQGNYTIENIETVKEQIFLRYANNKNGSDMNIAGIYDKKNKVMGMMPHPERAVLDNVGGLDGRLIFEFIKNEAR